MSKVYILEPPTSGKVLIKSTVGDLDIELWSKECPHACRNFIQLCLDGFYDNTIFHRVVPGFIVQGGDPTGTGESGSAAFGQPFKDEFHSRLRFSRRGLVGVAKSNDENGSQFFLTLDETSELDHKHTLFGKVVGNTIFNMLRLADGEIENERPVYPHKIISTEVLANPFCDLKPRSVPNVETPADIVQQKPKVHARAIKKFGLLSFGDEAEEDELTLTTLKKKIKIKAKTAHDINDPLLLSEPLSVEPFNVPLPKDKEEQLLKEETDEERALAKKTEEVKAERQLLHKEISEIRKELRTFAEQEAKKSAENEANDGSFITQFNRQALAFNKAKDEINEKKGKGKKRENQTLELLTKFKMKMSAFIEPVSDFVDSNDTLVSLFKHELESAETSQIRAMDANRDDDPDRYDIYDPRNPMNKRRREISDQNVSSNLHRTRFENI
ncbi:hypothetical protein GJ496_010860 [Pomphorhynchus laevis]|nr:hypothetical protein GJ496_010860 [Pomphorhynchus laevis]